MRSLTRVTRGRMDMGIQCLLYCLGTMSMKGTDLICEVSRSNGGIEHNKRTSLDLGRDLERKRFLHNNSPASAELCGVSINGDIAW